MRVLLSTVLLLATFTPLRAEDPAAAASGPIPGPRAAEIEAIDLNDVLEPIRAEHELPALAAAVIRGQRLVAAGAVGVRRAGRAERVGLADRFHIGSCTKSMTATLCARLIELGKLDWDTTVADAFSDLKDEIDPGWHAVTLTQLLCHRSGLPEDRMPGKIFMRLRQLDGPLPAQRRELVRMVFAEPPTDEPGSAFAYSNNGITVAAAMAEAATGESWEALTRTHLFEPLGMASAGFGPPGLDSPDSGKKEHPWGHRTMGRMMYVRPSPLADNPPVTGPAGNVHCSVLDWARYAALHLTAARGAGQMLKPETFRRLHSDQFDQGYAFGWGVGSREWAGGTVLQHAGSNTMWLARIVVAPQRDLAVVIATNRADEPAQRGIEAAIQRLITGQDSETSEAAAEATSRESEPGGEE